MKYIIEVEEVETCPENWTGVAEWPAVNRIYTVSDEPRYLYIVTASTVSIVYDKTVLCHSPAPEFPQGQVSESLLLRAIAAASRAEVLK
jgi:hypothetical protein